MTVFVILLRKRACRSIYVYVTNDKSLPIIEALSLLEAPLILETSLNF
jgi:hydrogenase-4 membrane subunit HyfE